MWSIHMPNLFEHTLSHYKINCNSVKIDALLRSHNIFSIIKKLNQALPLRVPPMLPVTHPT